MATSRAQQAATAERRRQAVALRLSGHSWDSIAAQLGYAGKAAAHKDVTRALAANRTELAETVDDMRQAELERLDELTREAWAVMRREHVTVSHGRVVRKQVGWEVDENGKRLFNDEGEPIPVWEDLLDDAPVLQAIDRLVKISHRRAALLGLDAPVRVEGDSTVRYEIVGVNMDKIQ